MFWVAFAGPLSNILTGFVSAFLLVGFAKFMPPSFSFYEPLSAMLQAFLMLNFSLAVFNLIPVPPLDGSNIVLSFLNYNAARKFLAIQQYANILLILLLFSGALRIIGLPISLLIGLSLKLAESVFGFALPA
jgi:Zn-dependent protease